MPKLRDERIIKMNADAFNFGDRDMQAVLEDRAEFLAIAEAVLAGVKMSRNLKNDFSALDEDEQWEEINNKLNAYFKEPTDGTSIKTGA